MSKRRKYDIKNKRSFIIILILSIAVIGIFSLFIYNYTKIAKIEYKIESGSVLQDVDKNYMTIDDDAVLKIGWNDNYYLLYFSFIIYTFPDELLLSLHLIPYYVLQR